MAKRVNDHIRDRLLSGVISSPVGDKAESHNDLCRTEWSPEFEQLMRNRLLIGRFRYGRMDRVEQRNYDRIGSAIARLKRYQETGNLEFVVDAANLCLMEFEHSEHPDLHFDAIDDGEHVSKT